MDVCRIPHAGTVTKFQAINAELDHYLIELWYLEFNLDSDEIGYCNEKIKRSMLLKGEVIKRDIELPYEIGNSASTWKWLAALAKRY